MAYNRNQLIGERIELLVPDDFRGLHAGHRHAFQTQPHQRPMGSGLEVYARRRDGTAIPVEISLSPMASTSGIFFASFITDISGRRQAAQELIAERDFARQVTATMGQGLAVTDVDGITTLINPALAALVGHPADTLVGAPLLDMVHPDDHGLVRRLYVAQTTEQTSDLELQLISADGGLRHVQVNCVALRQNEQHSGIVFVFSDMAKRKQIEQELKRARDQAQEASRLKSDFLATISHEMRTPLNSIVGVSELLADSQLDSAQRDLVQMIERAGERLLAQVNDILDFSKMEVGQLSLDFVPFDLRESLEACLDTILPAAAEKGLAIGYLLELPAPHRIYGDDQRLRQILVNLLENAVKYTEEGEINLTVTPYRLETDQPAYELNFAIQDTGIGIPPERQGQLFQGFSQLDASTTRKYEGAGLGLAISHRLCHAMGGQMWLESSGIPGKGSTIYFTLPTVEAAETEHEVKEPNSGVLQNRSLVFVLGSAHNAPLWRNLVLLVQSWAMDARLCTSLEEASAFVQCGGQLDAIVVDQALFEEEMVAMPMLNDPHWANSAVIVVTHGDHRWRRPASPGVHFIERPVKVAQFRTLLTRALSKPALSEISGRPGSPLFDSTLAERRPMRMLVVEDNRINQLVVQRMLSRLGYAVEIAEDGVAALDAIGRQLYDLVFMDMHMPVMDGLETVRRLRQYEAATGARRRTRIVALTANDSIDDRDACLAVGMDDHLSKPVRIAELRRVIEYDHQR